MFSVYCCCASSTDEICFRRSSPFSAADMPTRGNAHKNLHNKYIYIYIKIRITCVQYRCAFDRKARFLANKKRFSLNLRLPVGADVSKRKSLRSDVEHIFTLTYGFFFSVFSSERGFE